MSLVSLFNNPFFHDSFFPSPVVGFKLKEVWSPKCDVSEDEKSISIHAELPGCKKEDVKIEFENGVLTISGEKKQEIHEEDQEKKYHRTERTYGSFSRSLKMPKGTDASDITAEFNNGVLELTCKKKEKRIPEKQTIEIKSQM